MRKLSSNHFEDPKGSFRAFLDSFFYRQVRNKSPSVISVTQELYRVKSIGQNLRLVAHHLQDGKPSPPEIGKQRGGWKGTERQRFKETGTQTYFFHSNKTETKSHKKNEFAVIQWHVLCDANSKKK